MNLVRTERTLLAKCPPFSAVAHQQLEGVLAESRQRSRIEKTLLDLLPKERGVTTQIRKKRNWA
jgi:hypothetical protein